MLDSRFQIPRFIPHTNPTPPDHSDANGRQTKSMSDESDETGPVRPFALTSSLGRGFDPHWPYSPHVPIRLILDHSKDCDSGCAHNSPRGTRHLVVHYGLEKSRTRRGLIDINELGRSSCHQIAISIP
jgi:hypothetical protein